uniref:Putative conserved protein with signal anchor n=1 Tax=Ornithodoros turicata TaxID=34597 RepID=A0A2R5L622_9ACAR
MDPWSRRQQPFKVPKLRWYHRHFRYIRLAVLTGATALFLSRPIYDIFLRDYFEGPRPRIEISLRQLVEKPKEGEEPKPWKEFVAEQLYLAEERAQQKQEERKQKEEKKRLAELS